MAAKPRRFQLAITFSLLTTSGWGIPVLALSSQDLFCLPSVGFQQVSFPYLTHTGLGMLGLPTYSCHCQHWLLLVCLEHSLFYFSGMQAGRDKEAGVTHQEDKRIVHVFHTHFAWQPLTSSGCPKASNPERGGSLHMPDMLSSK